MFFSCFGLGSQWQNPLVLCFPARPLSICTRSRAGDSEDRLNPGHKRKKRVMCITRQAALKAVCPASIESWSLRIDSLQTQPSATPSRTGKRARVPGSNLVKILKPHVCRSSAGASEDRLCVTLNPHEPGNEHGVKHGYRRDAEGKVALHRRGHRDGKR